MAASSKATVDYCLKQLFNAETDMAFAVTLSDGSSVTLMQSAELLAMMSQLYGSYYWYPPITFAGASGSSFKQLWEWWLQRNNNNIARQLEALALDYNPINNYDLTEQAADGTRAAKTTITATPSGTMSVASVHTGTDTTTENRYGFDSSAPVPADKSELQHGETVTDTTSFTGYKTETETEQAHDQSMMLPDGNTGSGYDQATEHYLRRFGNIGVQTAADILGGELAIRTHDIALEWLQRFGRENFIYWG